MKTFPFSVNDPEIRMEFLTRFLPEAIETLDGDARPIWGKMTPQHMTEHLAWIFDLSTGKEETTCNIPEAKQATLKPWLYDDRPFPREVRNPKLPLTPGSLKYPTLREAKVTFRRALDQFIHNTKVNSEYIGTHPVFGRLSMDEWERFHFKHAFGHLVQFGLADYPRGIIMSTQADKAIAFRKLHAEPGTFIIPNPWDIGTARLLARLGFQALATTSAGYAFSIGKQDTKVGRDDMIGHVGAIASATVLPVSADLENGYGDDPNTVAETIRLAAAAGVVGGSIEDSTARPDTPIYEHELAAERIRAAAEAARSLPFPFTLTGRAENYLWGCPDLEDTITRLQAYQEAGADVLYAPGLRTKDEIKAVISSVDRPVNVLMGLQGVLLSLEELSELGAKRISVGGALARTALGAFLRAAREMKEQGTFTFAETAVSYREISAMFDA